MDTGTKNPDSLHWPIFCVGMLLLLISLPQHVFQTINPEGEYEDRCLGWEALLVGWFSLLTANLAWLANPLIIAVAALMRFKMWGEALTVASIAVGCSLMTFLWYKPIPTGEYFEHVLFVGAWFWFAAIACVWWSSFVGWRYHASTKPADPDAAAKTN